MESANQSGRLDELQRFNNIRPVNVVTVVAAIGYGTMQPAMQTMCIQSVSIVRRGVASNTNYFGVDMGNFLGPTLAGMVITAGFNYSEMYAFAIIPVFLSAIVFSLGWKKFKERRAELDKTEKI